MNWILAINIIMWILLFIILLLLALLFLPVRLIADYEEQKLKFKIKVMGLNLDLNRYKFLNKGKSKGNKDKPKKEKKGGGLKKIFKSFGYAKLVLKNANRLLTFIIKKIKFKKLILKIDVGSDSADKTAITYGSLCSVVYPVFSALFEINEPKNYDISLIPDFGGNSTNIGFGVDMQMRIIGFLLIAFEVYKILQSSSE